jgi:LuxR family maltose regulon positive regulatory protein
VATTSQAVSRARGGGRAATVLVTTKIHPPLPRRDLVLRPGLVEQLAAGSALKLSLVAAPAGWGKTTVLTEWLASRPGRRRAWVSLDRGDNDPARFWTYVVAALETVERDVGRAALAQLRDSGTSVIDVVLPALINDLAALAEPIVLVFDDFHVITAKDIHEQVGFLLEHLPPSVHLAIATRADPAIGLARLRARGELSELRADQLRFSEQETFALLNDTLRLGLDDADISRLQQRTEGWAAGLYLAALSLRSRGDRHAFVEAFAGDDRHLVDYLGAEVLAGQEAAVQSFLLETSILDRLCGPLCDHVREASGSARMLEKIERSNLFLHSLDAKREWYRYHPLFAELLQHELRYRDPDRIPALHRRASAWHRRRGAIPEAISHAIAAGDRTDAAELVARHWNAFFNEGQLTTVSDWLTALHDESVRDPRLSVARAWVALDRGRLAEVESSIEAATRGEPPTRMWDGSASLDSALAVLRLVHRFKSGDVAAAHAAARHALALERETSFGRTVALLLLGATHFWADEADEAAKALSSAAELARQTDNHLGSIYALGYLALARLELGDHAESEELSEEALAVADDPGRREHFVGMMAHLARSRILAHEGKLADAREPAARAVELGRRGAGLVEIAYASIVLAELAHALGAPGEGAAALEEARRAVRKSAAPGKVDALLAHAERTVQAGAPKPPPAPSRGGENLSERELAVLRLLPTQLSQREIGASLYVSVNTVKTHMKSIFRKLGVSSREDAVAEGRSLGLI